MFLTVRGKADRMHEVPAYLYTGQSVVTAPEITRYGSAVVIVDLGTTDRNRSEYVRDRLGSGLFGAVLFNTLEEATSYIESEKD